MSRILGHRLCYRQKNDGASFHLSRYTRISLAGRHDQQSGDLFFTWHVLYYIDACIDSCDTS
jgi:hypothetical protein